MNGTTYKRCGCKPLPCPEHGSDRCPRTCKQRPACASTVRRHFSWFYAIRVDTTDGRQLVRRGGFDRKTDAEAQLQQVNDLIGLEADPVIRARVVDLIVAASRRGGQLPDVAAVRRKLGAGLDPASPDLTVAEHLEAWFATGRTVCGRPWKQSVKRSYRSHLDLYLRPQLGGITLSRLRAEHIAGMLDQIAGWNAQIAAQRADGNALIVLDGDTRKAPKPVSNATLGRVYATLRTAMNAAVRQRLIQWNPCAGVRPGEPEEHEHDVWGPDEMTAFLQHATAAGNRLALLYRLVLLAGLRRGEVTGLTWADLDLAAAQLRVTHEVLQLGGKIVHDTPKSKTSVRTVSLDAETVRLLRAHYDAQVLEHLEAGEAYADAGLVFCDELGGLYAPDSVSRWFKKAAVAAGLRPIKLHEGRHSSATMAMEAGIDIKRVSARLGHSTTAITSDIYTHVRRPVADADAEAMASLLTRKAAQ